MTAHSRELVSWIKGALRAGLRPKLIARRTGIPLDTIKEWAGEQARGDVPADEDFGSALEALLTRFGGRRYTR